MKNALHPGRGSALLVTLWLTAALGVVVFSVASTVRAETERASTDAGALRAYYLASGSVERALLWIEWGSSHYQRPSGGPMFYEPPMPRLHFEYPGGAADVEIIPEGSRLNVNSALPEDLFKLMLAAGAPPGQARGLTSAILDWRAPPAGGGASPFDAFYLSRVPSFQARHASFEEIEELLLVQGMTPELFYGGWRANREGQLLPYGGIRDALSVYGSAGPFDANTVSPVLLGALGFSPEAVAAIVRFRQAAPLQTIDGLRGVIGDSPAMGRLGIGGGSVWTIRATATLRLPNGQLSDLRRSAAALVAFLPPNYAPPYQILRWYDNAPPSASQPIPAAPPAIPAGEAAPAS